MAKKFLSSIFFLLCVVFLSAQIIGNWTLTGPSKFPTNIIGQVNGMGRVSQIKFHPTNLNKVYAVSGTGGLWISNNSGTSWNFTGTDNLPQHDFASVCVDYTNDSILYLGGGDANYYQRGLYGIWKSVDAGTTWTPSNTGIGNRLVIEMLMSPLDHNAIIAATDDGIFKTYDGGANWVEKYPTEKFTDMVYKPVANSSIIYAVSYKLIFRSTDLGETWDTLTNGVAIPNGDGEGMRLAVTPADTNRIYVGMIANRGNILRSNDGGDSWLTVKNDFDTSLVGYAIDQDGQGNYDFTLIAHPLHPDWLFLSAHCHWRSLDGGYSWEKLTNWWTNCHTDMHDYEFNPANPDELLSANDGGVWTSSDTAQTWNAKCDFLNNTEFYHAGQSNLNRGLMDGGTQDNGELYMSYYNWFTNRGGDWTTKMAFDFLSSDYCYEIAEGTRRGLTGGETNLNFPFTPDNTVELEFTPDAPQTAFVSFDDVWRTDTLASNNFVWQKISNIGIQLFDIASVPGNPNILYAATNNKRLYRTDNALDANPTWAGPFTLLTATNVYASIATVSSDTNVVYISCNNKIYRSVTKGSTWSNVTLNLPNTNIKKIVYDVYSTDESIYALVGNAVWYKNNTMSNWVNYTFGLPTIAQSRDLMIFNNGTPNAVLRLSFFGRGIWETPLYSTPICQPSDSSFATNITMNSASLNWTASGNGNYILVYKALNATQWDTVNVSANSFSLSALSPDTKYVFRVQSHCNGNYYSGFSLPCVFTTACEPIPTQWSHEDIGTVGVPGDVCYDSPTQTYRMIGSGKDIWDYEDHFHYMYQRVHGDVTMMVLCESIEDIYEWTKAGPMLRETLDSNSAYAMTDMTGGNGAAFQRRHNNTTYSANTNDTSFHTPLWLRLSRVGNTYTGSASNDGNTWTDIHASTFTMQDTVFIGLAHTSHIDALLNNSVFRFIDISPTSAVVSGVQNMHEANLDFEIFPNPAKELLTVYSLQFTQKKSLLEVFDVAGRKVFSTIPIAANCQLSTANWSNGIYFLEVKTGNTSATKKFVVAH